MSYQNKLFQLALCLGLSFLTLGVLSVESKEYSSLSFDGALIFALQSHPLIRSAEGQYRAAKSDLSGARWSRFPTVAVGAQESSDKINKTPQQQSSAVGGRRLNAEIDLINPGAMVLCQVFLRLNRRLC